MWPSLLVGIAVLLLSMLSYGIATALMVHLVVLLIHTGYTGLQTWKNLALMMVIALIMVAAHLIQVGLWAIALLLTGEIATFETAFYYSAENYTALGYGDIGLSERWRLLGPLEAINGLLLFGLTTATMFAVMSRLITHQYRFRFSRPGLWTAAGMTDEG
jgi:hypothetical protein